MLIVCSITGTKSYLIQPYSLDTEMASLNNPHKNAFMSYVQKDIREVILNEDCSITTGKVLSGYRAIF
jgi:hypothetical protein